MPGMLDALLGLAGRPDPSMQLASMLGQAPGQPGSATGPIPGSPPPSPGAPSPGGGPPSAGGPQAQGQQQAPPQPQAYQSPPDLAQMYMQLQQRHDASENFNRGLGLLAASAYPGRHPEMIMNAMTGASGADPGSTFGNLMKIQQWNIQNQQQAALRMAIPNMLKQAGLDESYAPLVQADPSILSKLVENQAGIGGGPAWQAQIRAEKAYTAAGKTPPWTAGDPASYGAYVQGQNTEAVARHKDLVADTANFVPAKNAYDSMISDAQNLLTTPGLDDIVGSWTNKSKSAGTPGLAPTTQSALAAYDKIMGQQYASGVQDFKGAGRISQQELKQDLPGQSTMSNRMQSPTDFRAGVQAYIDKLQTKRATLAGQAGQLGQLSDHDYSLVNDVYKPGGDLYVPGQAQRAAPAIVTSPDDVAKLPPGRAYIVPSGSHKGETRYAGIAQ